MKIFMGVLLGIVGAWLYSSFTPAPWFRPYLWGGIGGGVIIGVGALVHHLWSGANAEIAYYQQGQAQPRAEDQPWPTQPQPPNPNQSQESLVDLYYRELQGRDN